MLGTGVNVFLDLLPQTPVPYVTKQNPGISVAPDFSKVANLWLILLPCFAFHYLAKD